MAASEAAVPACTRRRREIEVMACLPVLSSRRIARCVSVYCTDLQNGPESGFSRSLFDVLDLLAQLLDRHLHVDRDRRHLDRGRLRAERVGLAQQLLDQELEALAYLAALGDQARDLVEVRAQ